jgi:hypothetical protein
MLTGTPPSSLGARVVRATGDALIIAGKANIAVLLNETSLTLSGAASYGEILVSDVRSIVAVSPVSLLVNGGGGGGGGNEIPLSELSSLGGGVGVAFAVGTLLLIFGVYRYRRRSRGIQEGNNLFTARSQSLALSLHKGNKVAESSIKNPLHVQPLKSPKSSPSPRPSPLSIKGRTAGNGNPGAVSSVASTPRGTASPLSTPKKNIMVNNPMSPKLKHSASTEKLTPHPTDFILQ